MQAVMNSPVNCRTRQRSSTVAPSGTSLIQLWGRLGADQHQIAGGERPDVVSDIAVTLCRP